MVVIVAAVVVGVTCARAAHAEPSSPGPGCVTFFGDVMLARHVAAELARNARSPWAALRADPGLARAWVGNLEGTVVATPQPPCPRRDGLCLGIEPASLAWLATSRFRALSIANNHIEDFGTRGRAATREALAAHGIVPVGEDAPATLDIDGVEWALVSLNLAGRPAAETQAALERARFEIGLARARTGRVVVLPHWGREGAAFIAPEQEEWAALFVRWGATLIIGSHAHVVQPARCDAGAATYFGLGNHLFDQTAQPAREGLAVTCCPRGEGFRCTSARTERSATSVVPNLAETPPDETADVATAWPSAACTVDAAAPDRAWLAHPAHDTLLFVQPFPTAGPRTFFAVRQHWSSFDHENALRPYVFRVDDQPPPARPRVVDVWRGTALGRPLVAARLFDWQGRQLLCAIHRDDTFLAPRPKTTNRVRALYRWTGFGFAGVDDDAALSECAQM